jgi:hypothetical protein
MTRGEQIAPDQRRLVGRRLAEKEDVGRVRRERL